jgi:hypothetical protein
VVLKKVEIPLEVVILLTGSVALLTTGIVFFAVSRGVLPYYENGFYGLSLVVLAMQTIMLGKTPFGDMRRSHGLLIAGAAIAGVGILGCFIPVFNRLPRLLLLVCLGPGNLVLLVRMCFSRDKFRAWIKYGGAFRHLIISCSAVYCFSMLIALVLVKGNAPAAPVTAALIVVYGIAVLYLAGVLRSIYRAFPEAGREHEQTGLSTDQSMIFLSAIFMIILGIMLIPVSLGVLPFSASAQVGLLIVIFAVQMLATGSTPIGPFPRSWPIIVAGVVFAALGVLSCVVPGILVKPLTLLVGVLNILGGTISLVKMLSQRLRPADGLRGPLPPLLTKLFAVQLVLNILGVMFGTSVLIPNLLHGLIIGVILAANGVVLLYLLRILVLLDRMQAVPEGNV